MKPKHIVLILCLQIPFVHSETLSEFQKIEAEASLYRMLAIECITDKKITKQESVKIESCKKFNRFVTANYPALKSNLEKAQEQVKTSAQATGLESASVRQSLILLMSARSHMKIAGEISAQI